jgi:NhaA family Na+:H+ antiporter
VVPSFALANAGVELSAHGLASAATDAVAIGIVVGLVIGKPVGIVGASALAVRTGVAELPSGMTFRHVLGAGIVAGIGFTVAIFIAELAFTAAELDVAKIAILVASVVAGVAGFVVLRSLDRSSPTPADSRGRR